MNPEKLKSDTAFWNYDQLQTYILNYAQLASAIQHSGGCVGRVMNGDAFLETMKLLAANYITLTATHDYSKTTP